MYMVFSKKKLTHYSKYELLDCDHPSHRGDFSHDFS
jgi:hypothetical protein